MQKNIEEQLFSCVPAEAWGALCFLPCSRDGVMQEKKQERKGPNKGALGQQNYIKPSFLFYVQLKFLAKSAPMAIFYIYKKRPNSM
jgi:hypothetical protein